MASVTVGILTYNSGITLRRALESVKDFTDIVVCDGGSTDDTLAIAHEFGARTIAQDPQFKNAQGRLANWSGVRNQILDAAGEWVFFLDSDEYASPELAAEIKSAAQGVPAAYWVPRKYVLKGEIIDNASTYPNRQMRFFHKDAAKGYIKEVHERIELKPDAAVRSLRSFLMTPLPETPEEMLRKWRGYLAIEAARREPMSLRSWLYTLVHEGGIAGLLFFRMGMNFFRRGNRLPLRYEVLRLWYQWHLIKDSFAAVSRW